MTALLLGVAIAVAGPEIVYRVARSSALGPTTNPSYVVHDATLGWRYEPNARARHRTDEFDVELALNARGFRGPEWPKEKRSPRVLVLGDSFAFGWGVAWDDTFAARVARERADWQVLDAAVSGYATDQELLLLRELLPGLRPDVVVCVFCSNDLWESSSEVAYGKHKPRFVRPAGASSGLELTGVPVPRSWLERTSALWRAWEKRRWERAFLATPRDRRAEWALACDLYRAMRDELHGVPLVIVSDTDRLAGLAIEERGMTHVDVRAAFGSDASAFTFARDGHWNAKGHAAVAAALVPAIEAALKR